MVKLFKPLIIAVLIFCARDSLAFKSIKGPSFFNSSHVGVDFYVIDKEEKIIDSLQGFSAGKLYYFAKPMEAKYIKIVTKMGSFELNVEENKSTIWPQKNNFGYLMAKSCVFLT